MVHHCVLQISRCTVMCEVVAAIWLAYTVPTGYWPGYLPIRAEARGHLYMQICASLSLLPAAGRCLLLAASALTTRVLHRGRDKVRLMAFPWPLAGLLALASALGI